MQKERSAKERVMDCAESISHYYGFEAVSTPVVTAEDIRQAKQLKRGPDIARFETRFSTEDKVACLRSFMDAGYDRHPSAQLFHAGTAKTPGVRADAKERVYSLHILNTKQSVAEAIVIRASLAILEHLGHKGLTVKVNSVGGKDALARYHRELSTFCKKVSGTLDATGREVLKKGPYSFVCSPSFASVRDEMPQSISYLNEESRRRFEEVLEFLESNEIPYEIDPTLVGSNIYSSDTVFEVVDELGKSLVTGSRHDALAKKIGAKRDMPSVGALIHVPTAKIAVAPLPHRDPRFYFIQLGFDAKLKSLRVIDLLRKAHIPVHQALSRDRISAQLSTAQGMGIPYVIIMGQHEALRNVVLVRNMETRSQDTVPLDSLVPALKRYLKAVR